MNSPKSLDGFPSRHGQFALTNRALELSRLPAGAFVLDIGCGRGCTVELLRRLGLKIFGCDRQASILKGATSLFCADGSLIPCFDSSFDGVLLECSLSTTAFPESVLQECHRVLKAGGKLLLSDVYARNEAFQIDDCTIKMETKSAIITRILRHGFLVDHVEDCSEYLLKVWGQMLMNHGSDHLYREIGIDPATLRQAQIGYILVVARREAA